MKLHPKWNPEYGLVYQLPQNPKRRIIKINGRRKPLHFGPIDRWLKGMRKGNRKWLSGQGQKWLRRLKYRRSYAEFAPQEWEDDC